MFLLYRLAYVSVAAARLAAAAPKEVSFGAHAAAEIPDLVAKATASWDSAGGRCPAAAVRSSGADATEAWWDEKPADLTAPGCQGGSQLGGLLLPALRFVYEGLEKSGAFLDAGAFIGRFAAEVMGAFGQLDYKKFVKEGGTDGERCQPADPKSHSVSVFCFEPTKAAYDKLKDRAKRSAWQLESFNVMQAAVSNTSGKINIYSDAAKPDHKASATPREGLEPSEAKAVSLDTVIKKTIPQGRAFLAHFAMNGYEANGLAGLKKSMKARTVRFVLFEVSPLWPSAGNDLGGTVKKLWKEGYACFAMLPEPVPISGPFWRKELVSSGPAWFKVFCGAIEDPGLRRVLRVLDPDGPDWVGKKD